MSQETEIEQPGDKLPHNHADLLVAANLEAARQKHDSLGGKKGKKRKRGRGYLKCRMIKGRPYWYLVVKVMVSGDWKNRDIYMGTKKPGVKQIKERLERER